MPLLALQLSPEQLKLIGEMAKTWETFPMYEGFKLSIESAVEEITDDGPKPKVEDILAKLKIGIDAAQKEVERRRFPSMSLQVKIMEILNNNPKEHEVG